MLLLACSVSFENICYFCNRIILKVDASSAAASHPRCCCCFNSSSILILLNNQSSDKSAKRRRLVCLRYPIFWNNDMALAYQTTDWIGVMGIPQFEGLCTYPKNIFTQQSNSVDYIMQQYPIMNANIYIGLWGYFGTSIHCQCLFHSRRGGIQIKYTIWCCLTHHTTIKYTGRCIIYCSMGVRGDKTQISSTLVWLGTACTVWVQTDNIHVHQNQTAQKKKCNN